MPRQIHLLFWVFVIAQSLGLAEEPILPNDFGVRSILAIRTPTNLLSDGVLEEGTELEMNPAGEILLYRDRDAIQGLKGKGLQIAPQKSGTISISGRLRVGRQSGVVAGAGGAFIDRTNKGGPGSAGAIEFVWAPEPVAVYRDRLLIGIWEPAAKRFRAATPGEALPKLPPIPLPTIERTWTHKSGIKIVGVITEYESKKGTVSIKMTRDGKLYKGYQVENLSKDDQEFLKAYSDE